MDCRVIVKTNKADQQNNKLKLYWLYIVVIINIYSTSARLQFHRAANRPD
ncbi:MAG: hypothetical protein A4E71_01090 [Smithella sp. PtaU1.Bin162]|nr:MAG: hypothetical protein A4E71_01090 [Smithella sp. PtaU1.Bin162]